MEQAIVNKLGAGTRLASEVNGIAGLWISLSIADDDYWVYINRDPVVRTYGTQWIGWAAVALLLSVIGAILITRLINRPLAQLSRASAELGSGRNPPPLLPKRAGRDSHRQREFNRMVADLGKLEADRALLAGISHDLRTPLSRLRLELEMAHLPEAFALQWWATSNRWTRSCASFSTTRERHRRRPQAKSNLSAAVAAATHCMRIDAEPDAAIHLTPRLISMPGLAIEIDRALDNLLTNAVRYGRDPEDRAPGRQRLAGGYQPRCNGGGRGPGAGVSPDDIERLMRPFDAVIWRARAAPVPASVCPSWIASRVCMAACCA